MRKLCEAAIWALTVLSVCASNIVLQPRAAAQPPTTGQQPPVPSLKQEKARVTEGSEAKARPAMGSKALAELVWAVTDAVGEHHDKPTPRQQLIAASLKALYQAQKATPPADLAKLTADVKSAAELALLYGVVLDNAEAAARGGLEDAALQGVLTAVPGHASLVDAPSQKEQAVQEQINANRYVGIGIALAKVAGKDDHAKVTSTIARGAARKAGMLADDIIESVDGKDTKDVALGQVVDWLRGGEGTTVTVTVRQPNAKESRTLKMVRAKVPFEHVFGYRRISDEEFDFRVDPAAPIAYVRIGAMSISALHELRQFERKLHAKGFKALIIDLRGNPGGNLQHAALLCGGLLDGNLMWTVRQDRHGRTQEARAEHESLFRDWPIAVLVDERTHSAATLIAAALHDSGRAILVGEPAQMDGYIKGIFPLPEQKQTLVLPIGRIERPKAELGWPLQPDILVKTNPEQKKTIMEWTAKVEQSDKIPDAKTPGPKDPQLARAIEILQTELAKTKVTQNR
jgi:carboxyl-terminal processing protease